MNPDVEKFLRELAEYDRNNTTDRMTRDTATWAAEQAWKLLKQAGKL